MPDRKIIKPPERPGQPPEVHPEGEEEAAIRAIDYAECQICGAQYRKGSRCPNADREDHRTKP
jgi:hypothetical protein